MRILCRNVRTQKTLGDVGQRKPKIGACMGHVEITAFTPNYVRRFVVQVDKADEVRELKKACEDWLKLEDQSNGTD